MATIALDRGHHGRTGGRRPATHEGRVEDVLVRDYMAACEDALRALGHEVIVVSWGRYEDRQRAHRFADVYVAGHVNWNDPPGDYALCGYDHRSTLGPVLARAVARRLGEEWGEVLSGARPKAARPDDWTAGMYHVIAGVYEGRAVGLCVEPGFINCEEHEAMWTPKGLQMTGRALAVGIVDYLDARGIA